MCQCFTLNVSTILSTCCWWISCFLQEKVKAVFDNLIQLEHLNIVKFHKYWADVKENRARVGGCFLCELKSPFVLFQFGWHFLFPPAGHFHHWVHVFRKSQTILKEDKEKSQDHEWEGARAQMKLTHTWRIMSPWRDLLIFLLCPTGLETLVHTNPFGAQVIQQEKSSTLTSGFDAIKVDQTFVSLVQLPALVWPSHHPWQPHLWHHLHSTQWPHQDWLR